MIALLGSLLGLFGSVLPEIAKFFQDKRDKKHELEMLKVQAENAAALREYDAKMFAAQAEASFYTAEQERLGSQQNNDKTGIKFIDGLNASVRPVLAYGFFILYAAIKVVVILNLGIDTIIENPWILFGDSQRIGVWNDEDAAIFAGIISFYYGSRTMERYRKGFK
jgi:hypothetical protein